MRIIGLILICLISLQFTLIHMSSNTSVMRNAELKTIKAGYVGNPLRGKKFINYEDVPLPNFGKVLKWKWSRNPQREEKKKDTWLPEVVQNNGMFSDKRRS